MKRDYETCTRCYGSGDSPDSNGDNQYPCELCDGSGSVLAFDTPPLYTLIEVKEDGKLYAIDQREQNVEPCQALEFWHLDGELYAFLPDAYTVLERNVEALDAFLACGVPFEVDEEDERADAT